MNLLIRALFPTPSSPTTTTLHSHILYSTVTIIILILITNYVCNKCILVTTSVYHLLTPAQPSYDWVSLCGPALPGCLSYRGHNNSDCEHLHHLHSVFRVHLEWDMMMRVLIWKGLRLLCTYIFSPKDLKSWYWGRFGCFLKVPKVRDLTSNIKVVSYH